MKFDTKIFLIAILLSGPNSAQNKVDPVELLLEKNREVLAARQAYQSAVEAVNIFGVLPDPIGESSLFLKPVETRNGPMEGQLMLGQRFPLWGKLKRERNVAELKAEIAALNLEQTEITVAFQMRKHWENYVRLKNSLEILDQYSGELETFRSIALTQYETGLGLTQHPILKLQIEVSLIESEINTLQSNFESMMNSLQSLFDGSFSPELFGDLRSDVLPSNPDEFWLDKARETHPVYLKAQRGVQIAELQNELAIRDNYPDLVTGLTYTLIGEPAEDSQQMSPSTAGADAFGFRVGLNLPIWFNRNRARVESTKLNVRSKEEIVEEVWNLIEDDTRSTKKDMDEIEETYALYGERLLQESEQMLASAFSAYETGKISFLDLLDSERMVVRVRLDFERIEAERRIASAQMLKAIGLVRPDKE